VEGFTVVDVDGFGYAVYDFDGFLGGFAVTADNYCWMYVLV
jgi:hypothetical protein